MIEIERICHWLDEEGNDWERIEQEEDAEFPWRLAVEYPSGEDTRHELTHLPNRDTLVFASGWASYPTQLDQLDEEQLVEFEEQTKLDLLNIPRLSYELQRNDDGVPERILFQREIYEDELSKSTLYASLDTIYDAGLTYSIRLRRALREAEIRIEEADEE